MVAFPTLSALASRRLGPVTLSRTNRRNESDALAAAICARLGEGFDPGKVQLDRRVNRFTMNLVIVTT